MKVAENDNYRTWDGKENLTSFKYEKKKISKLRIIIVVVDDVYVVVVVVVVDDVDKRRMTSKVSNSKSSVPLKLIELDPRWTLRSFAPDLKLGFFFIWSMGDVTPVADAVKFLQACINKSVNTGLSLQVCNYRPVFTSL